MTATTTRARRTTSKKRTAQSSAPSAVQQGTQIYRAEVERMCREGFEQSAPTHAEWCGFVGGAVERILQQNKENILEYKGYRGLVAIDDCVGIFTAIEEAAFLLGVEYGRAVDATRARKGGAR